MIVRLNDQEFALAAGTLLIDFLAAQGFRPERVLLEVNGEIIPTGLEHRRRVLQAGDRLVALKLVAGG